MIHLKCNSIKEYFEVYFNSECCQRHFEWAKLSGWRAKRMNWKLRLSFVLNLQTRSKAFQCASSSLVLNLANAKRRYEAYVEWKLGRFNLHDSFDKATKPEIRWSFGQGLKPKVMDLRQVSNWTHFPALRISTKKNWDRTHRPGFEPELSTWEEDVLPLN